MLGLAVVNGSLVHPRELAVDLTVKSMRAVLRVSDFSSPPDFPTNAALCGSLNTSTRCACKNRSGLLGFIELLAVNNLFTWYQKDI